MTTKEALKILEHLYDLVLDIEQLRREQSSLNPEDAEVVDAWYEALLVQLKGSLNHSKRNARYSELVQQLWDSLRVMVPLETRQASAGSFFLTF